MQNEENESANIKALHPLTPQQDNRAFESIPKRPAPWSKSEAGSPMNRERALSMFRTANQWLYDKLQEGASCECGNCYLCAYNFFASAPPSTSAAIRAAAEEIANDRLGPRGDGPEVWDKYSARVAAILSRWLSRKVNSDSGEGE